MRARRIFAALAAGFAVAAGYRLGRKQAAKMRVLEECRTGVCEVWQ
jgi:hypothetical protein